MHPGHRQPGFLFTLAISLLLFVSSSVYGSGLRLGKRADFKACNDVVPLTGHPKVVNAPILKYTITSFNPNWFNDNSGQPSSPLFTATLSSSLVPYTTNNRLTMSVYVWADTNLTHKNPLASPVQAFKHNVSLDEAHIGFLTSSDIFALPVVPGDIGVDFKGSDLYNLVMVQHQVPPLNLHIELALLCGGVAVTEGGVNVKFDSAASLRFVHTLQALSPGTDVGNSRAVPIYTLSPVFRVVSDLLSNSEFNYPSDEPKMEIFIYQLQEGQQPKDALNGTEFARFPVTSNGTVSYPSDLPILSPGQSYIWRVRGLLRGTTNEYIFSNTLYFLVDPRLAGGSSLTSPSILSDPKAFAQEVRFGDDYVKRVLAALKLILGENYEVLALSHIEKIPAKGQIRLNGHPYSLEELERLAQEFHQSHHSLTRLRFQ